MQEDTEGHEAVSNECQASWQSGECHVGADKLTVAALHPPLTEALPGCPLAIRDEAASVHQFNALPVLLEVYGQGDVIDGGHADAGCRIPARCQVGLAPQEDILAESECAWRCRVPHLCRGYFVGQEDLTYGHKQRHGRAAEGHQSGACGKQIVLVAQRMSDHQAESLRSVTGIGIGKQEPLTACERDTGVQGMCLPRPAIRKVVDTMHSYTRIPPGPSSQEM